MPADVSKVKKQVFVWLTVNCFSWFVISVIITDTRKSWQDQTECKKRKAMAKTKKTKFSWNRQGIILQSREMVRKIVRW